MNHYYKEFIAHARSEAERRGLIWDLPYDDLGLIPKQHRWNISRLCNMTLGTTSWLSTFETFKPALKYLNACRSESGVEILTPGPMSVNFIEFYKAVLIHCVFTRSLRPHSAINNIGRYIRLLALCATTPDPWRITGSDIHRTYNVALTLGESGKDALNVKTMVTSVFDRNHLVDFGPIASHCVPDSDELSQSRHVTALKQRKRENTYRKTEGRKSLDEKTDPSRLPDMDMFWELLRIIFHEKPDSLSDAIRFLQYRLMVLTGLRVGELVRIPENCLIQREYFDHKGRSTGLRGGIATSWRLRYFAEKQTANRDQNGFVLTEAYQDVPDIFADTIRDIVDRARKLTLPLRERLKRQVETGRLLSEYEPNALIPDYEAYLRLSGSIHLSTGDVDDEMVEAYLENFSLDALTLLRAHEQLHYRWHPNRRIREYFLRCTKQATYLHFRREDGTISIGNRAGKYFFRVSELERFMVEFLTTKLPNLTPANLSSGGQHEAYDFLFIYPTRSVVEDRNGGIIDVVNYAYAGLGSELDLQQHLGGRSNNIFTRYGKAEAKEYKINPHSLRHLLNNELFRHGVSDALISLHFGRKSPAQSHAYNHKSLVEDLDYMEVPGDGDQSEADKNAKKAFTAIHRNKIEGSIVVEFRRLQATYGDDAAFQYLKIEAGGFHVTPYGVCLNSFTVDPCPKHLQCFNRCKHFARTGLPSETKVLEDLRERTIDVITAIESNGLRSKGAKNQFTHALELLNGIDLALATQPGKIVHPNGNNNSKRFVVTQSPSKGAKL